MTLPQPNLCGYVECCCTDHEDIFPPGSFVKATAISNQCAPQLHHESLGRSSVVQQQQVVRTALILFSVLQHIRLLSQEHLPRDPSLAPPHSRPRAWSALLIPLFLAFRSRISNLCLGF